jgi:putative protease
MANRKPELLAPAGNPQALRAAVENGADAVYLAGKMFGARAFADNFDRSALKDAFEYAHTRNVRIYITVNTLVDNREFGEFTDYLFFLYREGADALIVQDLGAAAMIKELLPDISLHGSTQMTVHNAAGVRFLEELGFDRVILAREVGYADLLQIRKKTTMDLEVFVHGALCFCYSGQCLFSSMVGGRSGNRGRCAQPCRLPYQLVDEKGRELYLDHQGEHLMSPQDLMLIRELPDLVKAGISSLKIEGRMKSPEYVATVVRIYKEALQRAWEDPDNYKVTPEEIRDLALVFNRGFTTGYFYGNPGSDLMGYTKPNNRGLHLGRVLKGGQGKIRFKTKLPITAGDEIEFWTAEGCRGVNVQEMYSQGRKADEVLPGSEVEINIPFFVRRGDRVFKTRDRRLEEEAREGITGPSKRRIPLNMRAVARIGKPFLLEGWDEDGYHYTAQGEFIGEKARKHELTGEAVRAQVDRLGNTPFVLQKLECEIEPGVIFPVSEINAVRRQLTEALERARLLRYRRKLPGDAQRGQKKYWSALKQHADKKRGHSSELPGDGVKRPYLAVAVGDFAGLKAALRGGADLIYFGGYSLRGREPWTEEKLRAAVDQCRKQGAAPYLMLPRIWQEGQEKVITKYLEHAKALAAEGVLAGDLGGCYYALQDDLRVVADFSLPVFNDPAADLLLKAGVSRITLSPELNRRQLKGFAFKGSGSLEMIIHGALPLVISEHCIPGALAGGKGICSFPCRRSCFLKDRRGYLFPVVSDESCRMTIYNSRELCLIEQLAEITADGYYILRLELRPYPAEHVFKVTSLYCRALTAAAYGEWNHRKAISVWEELAELSQSGLTRGHYLRGVLQDDSRGEEEA